jgi:hypothetical protein
MRNLCRLLLLLLWSGVGAEVACAQLTNVTAAANSISIGDDPISTGTVVFIPVNSSGVPIAITKSGGGLALPSLPSQPIGFPCTLASGGISGSCGVPDTALSSPAGFAYNVTICDTSEDGATSGQCATLVQVHNVTGANWQLDHYSAGTSVSFAGAFTTTQGVGAPAGAAVLNSFYTDITTPTAPILYEAVGGVWAQVGGGGVGGSVTATSIASALGSRGGCTTAGASYVPATNTCTTFDASGAAAAVQAGDVQKSGGTMTGPLLLSGDPTSATGASTKQYVDANAVSNPGKCNVNTTYDKCLGVSPYLAVSGDWSAAINQALSDLSTTGGTIHGCGVYPVNAAFVHPTGSSVNTIVLIPSITSVAFATNVTIRAQGCQYTTPNVGALSGMTWQTSNDTAGANVVYGENSGNFTAVRLVLEHTNIVSTHAAPNINLLNASWLNALSLSDVLLAGTGCTAAPSSSVGGIGLQTPNLSNNFEVTLDKVVVSCMPQGVILREHTQIGTLWMGPNHDCVRFDGGGTGSNSITASYIWTQGCVNNVVGGPNSAGVNISMFDMESDPGTGLNIDDPSNLISGIIFYKKQSPSGVATIAGGSNLLPCNINAITSCFGSGGAPANPFLENWKSQDGSGTTLANTGSDSTNAMTATNVTWAAATGFTGNVATYNGSTSFSQAASATGTAFDGTAPFSACAWYNPSSAFTSATSTFLLSNLETGGSVGWALGLFGGAFSQPGRLEAYIGNVRGTNSVDVYAFANPAPTVGTIHLACITYDGTKTAAGMLIYQDGTAYSTTTVSDNLTGSSASTQPLDIGNAGPSGQFFPGAIGRVRVYSRKLSSAEVSAMFTAGPSAI